MGEVNKTKSISNSGSSYTDFYYHFFRNILLVGIILVIISALILSLPHSSANNSGSDTLTLTLSSSCTMSSVVDIAHNGSLTSGTYIQNIGQTTIKTLCNDGNGYAVYANGYSNNEEGNNKLINTEYPQYSIDTGLTTSGLTSTWAMKLNNIPDDPSPTPPTIESDYNNTYGVVPSYWTKVASRASGTTDMDEGSSFTTTYAVYTSSNQHAGNYIGQVKYVLTHPSYQPYVYYMQEVDKWKNTLALEQSVQAIDKRDSKQYWVTKLKDGNVWMTQNLDLDLDPTKLLTSNDTDLTDHSLAGAYVDDYNYNPSTGVTTWTPERGTIDFQNATVTSWNNDNNNPYSANKTDDTNTGHTSLGNYYNWTAAIASNDSSTLTQDTLNNIANNPQNSICPKGWRLPTISNQSGSDTGSTNEYARLNYLYNSNSATSDANLLTSPLYFVRSGDVYNGSVRSMGQEGKYISGTLVGAAYPYVFLFQNSLVDPAYTYPGTSLQRGNGYPVRCVAR